MAPNFACLKLVTSICGSFAQEYYLVFNAKKTVCILSFSGRSRCCSDPPSPYMNNVSIKWTKSAEHVSSRVLCHIAAICLVFRPGNWTRRVSRASLQLDVWSSGGFDICQIQYGQISCPILSAPRY